jgi:signal transduction histidine kinase
MTNATQHITIEMFEALKQAFDNSQVMFELSERAYRALQDEVKNVNLELERKNIALQKSLAERDALEREVLQAKTMAALGEMSATVAHEIRNPLGAMGVWAGLLERDLEPQDPRRKTLGKITEGLAKLNKIVSNLLVYTRPIAAEFRKVRLDALLDEIADFTEIEIERLGRNITVEKSFAAMEKPYVMADPEKMNQAIINLCLNAVQAMEDGGTLRVEIGGKCDIGGNGVNDANDAGGNNYIMFSVADTGSGIDREYLKKIFTPFFTTKEDGTGLGLAIVKKIIESHHGRIDIKSEVGAGTRVICYLPYSEDK